MALLPEVRQVVPQEEQFPCRWQTVIFRNYRMVPAERIAGYLTASWMLTRENKFFSLVNDAYTFYAAYRDVFGTLPVTDCKPWELID